MRPMMSESLLKVWKRASASIQPVVLSQVVCRLAALPGLLTFVHPSQCTGPLSPTKNTAIRAAGRSLRYLLG